MKNHITKVANLDLIKMEDLIVKHNLNDLEIITTINQGLTDAIILLTKEYNEESVEPIYAISRASSLLQDINRIKWDEYIPSQD